MSDLRVGSGDAYKTAADRIQIGQEFCERAKNRKDLSAAAWRCIQHESGERRPILVLGGDFNAAAFSSRICKVYNPTTARSVHRSFPRKDPSLCGTYSRAGSSPALHYSMVNRGASKGCITCRDRRVKCDQGKPECKTCLRLERKCEGYGKRNGPLRFKNQTGPHSRKPRGTEAGTPPSISHSEQVPAKTTAEETAKVTAKQAAKATDEAMTIARKHPSAASCTSYAIPSSPSIHQQDVAVSFFLTYCTLVGRSLESTRGFLEFVCPVLSTQASDSALVAAVTASATKLWTRLNHGRGVSASLQTRLLQRAVSRLQTAITHPEERHQDATVLATLVLQTYDTLAAVFSHDRARGRHREGALALLLQRDRKAQDSKYHAYFLANLLHSRVSFCVRESSPVPLDQIEWLETQVIPNLPINPSSLLDLIGISIANLQHAYRRSLSHGKGLLHYDEGQLSDNIRTVDTQLQQWLEIVPPHWYPTRVESGKDIDLSINTYRGACDIYPNVQIANIWNAWRIYRLILGQIKLRSASDLLAMVQAQQGTAQNDAYINDITGHDQHTHEARELVDAICYSVPFYLGNCNEHASLSAMENPHLMFPSYHDLHPFDQAYLQYLVSDNYVSKVDHSRHTLMHGPLHMLSILSHLIGLIAGERSLVMPQTLQQEQQYWLAEQFQRALLIRSLDAPKFTLEPGQDDFMQSQQAIVSLSKANASASTVKQLLWTLNIV